jgi:hypothetical protein
MVKKRKGLMGGRKTTLHNINIHSKAGGLEIGAIGSDGVELHRYGREIGPGSKFTLKAGAKVTTQNVDLTKLHDGAAGFVAQQNKRQELPSSNSEKLSPIDYLTIMRNMAHRAPKNMPLFPEAKARIARDLIAGRMAHAHLFSFDDALTRKATELLLEYPSLFMRLLPRIRLPFPSILMYYPRLNERVDDFDGFKYVRTLADFIYQASDTTLRVVPMALNDNRTDLPSLLPAPLSYVIHLEPERERRLNVFELEHAARILEYMERALSLKTLKEIVALRAISPEGYALSGLHVHLLGEAVESIGEDCMEFFCRVELKNVPWGGVPTTGSRIKLMAAMNGHASMVCALLVVLNLRTTITQIMERRQRGHLSYRGRSYTYFTEHTVTLKLPEPKVIKALHDEVKMETGIHHRRHEVRGHWCEGGGEDMCRHEWVSLDVNHSECSLCKRKSWFRKAHERGDASLGWVRKRAYNVESR